MIQCMIVDDEPLAVDLLSSYAEKVDELKVIGAFTNPLEALPVLQSEKVDLLFLDIQMPELSGLQLAQLVPAETLVVFTTAYPEHAVTGFELKALDYLVKPINLRRFLEAVNRCREWVGSAKAQTVESHPGYLFVRSEYRHQKIDLSALLYLKGLGDYVAVHTTEGKILTLENLNGFEQKLPPSQFMRIHKSYLIALEKIDYIERNRVVIAGEHLPVGPTYQERFWERIRST
ncbi:MAG: LytR/AlgR family response regulator transcription factor [Salibacteraceae bacterium]